MPRTTPALHRTLGSFVPLAFALVAMNAACGSDNNTAPRVATDISANTATNAQIDTVGKTLPQAVSVHVTDASGNAFANATVTWTTIANNGVVDPPTSTTNSTGDAIANWTLGTTAKADTLTAAISSGALVVITATANADIAAKITVVSGDSQTVAAGTATQPLIVKVADQFGNPVANAPVTWASSGGGTLSAATGTTDATGQMQVVFTTDPTPADYAVTATVGTFSVTFTLHGT